jgi:uncharacterized membrane protein
MATDAALLADVGFFKLLDDDERAVLAQQLEHRIFPAGATIFREGDPGGVMYVLRSGRVELWVYDEDHQRVVLATFEEGDFFGELSLFDQEKRSATATTLQSTEALVIDRTDLGLLFKQKPDAAFDVIAALGRRLRLTSDLVRTRAARNPNEVIEEHLTLADRVADWITNSIGSMKFIYLSGIWFFVWIVLNVGILPGIEPFDPFPFGLLTMIVSLEAIFLSIFVLISQNRTDAKDRVRSELDYRVNVKAELEVAELHAKLDALRNELIRAIDLAALYNTSTDIS